MIYPLETTRMTMAYSHLDTPLADPIRDNAGHAGGHHWMPGDFKQASAEGPEAPTRPTLRQTVLEEAAAAVTGAREDTYGGPEQSFFAIAKFWSAYLDRYIGLHDVAVMLALLKVARIKHSEGRHYDSWVDLAGYAACGAECALGEETA